MTDLTWEEWRLILIIHSLMNGDREPLIRFMREGGDMSKFSSEQMDVIEKVIRGEPVRRQRRPKSEKNHNRNVQLLFEVAWFSEIEGFPLTHPRYTKNSAFHKAAEAMGDKKVTPEIAESVWEKCTDKDYYRREVRD